jgi:hypothetical protein
MLKINTPRNAGSAYATATLTPDCVMVRLLNLQPSPGGSACGLQVPNPLFVMYHIHWALVTYRVVGTLLFTNGFCFVGGLIGSHSHPHLRTTRYTVATQKPASFGRSITNPALGNGSHGRTLRVKAPPEGLVISEFAKEGQI